MSSYSNYKELLEYIKNKDASSSDEVINVVEYSYLNKGENPSDEHFLKEKKRYSDHKEWIKGNVLVRDLLGITLYPCAPWVKELTNYSDDKTLKKGVDNLLTLKNSIYSNDYYKIMSIYEKLSEGSFDDKLLYVTILQFNIPFVQDGNHRLLALAKHNLNKEIKCYIGYNNP